MIRKITIAITLVAYDLSLAGCATPVLNQTTEQICHDYLKFSLLQIGQETRANELKRRRASCTTDKNTNTEKLQKDKNFETELLRFVNQRK